MNLQNLIKKFQFFLDIRGIDTEELPNAPTGWRDMIVEYARDPKYGGLLRQITGQLDFFGKAAYLLRREYAAYRLAAQVNLRINVDTCQPMNTYSNIYTGKIDFSKKIDQQSIFTANAKSLDFSQNISAYDSTQYSIPLTGGINLELPSLALNETATLVPGSPPDGVIHSNYFPPLQLVNNVQNSVDTSAYNVNYDQFANPDFSTRQSQFFHCRFTGKLLITGAITYRVDANSDFATHQKMAIYNQNGVAVVPIFDANVAVGSNQAYTFNVALDVTVGDTLFLYTSTDVQESNAGITIKSGEIDLSYQTITPPTMCQALSGSQLFAALLQAMNVNTDSAPNQPVFYQSYLLANSLAPLVFTCSDSIRAAQGSIYAPGNTLGDGRFKVISGTINYDGNTYKTGEQFTSTAAAVSFTGAGVVQKIQSIFVGSVYNAGDSLQSGGTYEVDGITLTGEVTYNSISYGIGQSFKYVLGQDTYTASDDTMFVKQVGLDPQIIISFADFFQCIKSIQGGDCAFGVNRYTAVNSTPAEQAKQLSGIPFMETLASVFKAGINQAALGNLSKDWQSSPATDLMFNTISVGQKDQQYDSINGYQEVSSEQYYGSALLTPVANLNLISQVRFDPYGAESVRITQNDTAASRSDNDTWGFWINTTAITAGVDYQYFRPLGSEGLSQPIIGVDPSYYNWMLSPKRNLLRGSRYLASIFYGMAGYQLTMTGHKKNTAMVTVGLDGVRVSESEPVSISTLGTPYFIPEYFSDTIACPDISVNEYADVTFVVNGYTWNAFVFNYKVNPAMNKPQQVKFLLTASPTNDLSRTVR